MDFRRQRSHQFLCQKWTIFTISLLILFSCVLLAALSNKIADKYVSKIDPQFRDEYKKEALEQALVGMAVMTGFFALFGIMGSLREHYCASLTFAIYLTVNTMANFYVALQASGLWLYAILNLCVAVIAFSFAKQLRARRLLSSSASAFVIDTTAYPHQTIIMPTNDNQWTTSIVNSNSQQWMPSSQPPPPYYTHDYIENPYSNSKSYFR